MKIQAITGTTLLALLPLPALATVPTWAAPQDAGSTTEQALPEARTILDRYLEETGAARAIAETTSARSTGTMEVVGMGLKGPMQVLTRKPNQMVVDIELGAMGAIRQGFDGETAWSMHPMMGATIQEDGERLQTVVQANYSAALKSPQDYEKLETIARTDFQGKECWKVEVVSKLPEGLDAQATLTTRTSHEYYDVESGLFAGQETIAASPMGEMRVVTILSDYKRMGHRAHDDSQESCDCPTRLQPTTALQKMSGQEMKITTESVVYDDVEPAEVALPKEIQVQVDARKGTAK